MEHLTLSSLENFSYNEASALFTSRNSEIKERIKSLEIENELLLQQKNEVLLKIQQLETVGEGN